MEQFESFRASSLYCKTCQKAMPVRESLLLVLPGKEMFEYMCTTCGLSLGQREVIGGTAPVSRLPQALKPSRLII